MRQESPTCPGCDAAMSSIKIIDKGQQTAHFELEYTSPEASRSFWMSRYPVEGKIEALMCAECGRVLLYGRPDE